MNHAIAATADNFIAHTVLGFARSRRGETDLAFASYREAIRINLFFRFVRLKISDLNNRISIDGNVTMERLHPGDIIAAGSPAGVGTARATPIYMKDGDRSSCTVEGIGTLANPVRADATGTGH